MSVQTTKEDEGTAENPTLVPSTEHARLIGCLCMYTGLKFPPQVLCFPDTYSRPDRECVCVGGGFTCQFNISFLAFLNQ
jgi:hypothetical protein